MDLLDMRRAYGDGLARGAKNGAARRLASAWGLRGDSIYGGEWVFALAGATRDTYRHVLRVLDEHRCGGNVYDWRVVLRRRGEPVEIFWRALDTYRRGRAESRTVSLLPHGFNCNDVLQKFKFGLLGLNLIIFFKQLLCFLFDIFFNAS